MGIDSVRGIREIQIFFLDLSLLPSEEVPVSSAQYKEMWVALYSQQEQVTVAPMHFQSSDLHELMDLLVSLSSVFRRHNHCSRLFLHT